MDNPDISKALTVVEESAYTDEQLLGYDKFWDIIRTERTIFNSAVRRGHEKGYAEGEAQGIEKGIAQGIEKGMAQGIEKGLEKGRAEGEREKALAIARKMKERGLPLEDIRDLTGLTIEEIGRLHG